MAKNYVRRESVTGRFVTRDDSVFSKPVHSAVDRRGEPEAPVTLRDDVHKRALNAAKRVLRSYRAEVRQGK
jgi:hypothetical protein